MILVIIKEERNSLWTESLYKTLEEKEAPKKENKAPEVRFRLTPLIFQATIQITIQLCEYMSYPYHNDIQI